MEIVIIGAGGHGKELASYLEDLVRAGEPISFLGFIDEGKPPGPFAGSRILGNFEALRRLAQSRQNLFYYITAVGDNTVREGFVRKLETLRLSNIRPWILRHPSALLGREVFIGEGTCLCPGSVVTTHVDIGRHCIVNVNVSISHDVKVGDFTNINPGVRLCGDVTIGEACYIGAGATVIEKVRIGRGTVVGAGALVTKDLPENVTAVGVPAKAIKRNWVNVTS